MATKGQVMKVNCFTKLWEIQNIHIVAKKFKTSPLSPLIEHTVSRARGNGLVSPTVTFPVLFGLNLFTRCAGSFGY